MAKKTLEEREKEKQERRQKNIQEMEERREFRRTEGGQKPVSRRPGEKERLEIAQARAKKKGLIAVETPEGFEEKTPEQAEVIPSVAEQERIQTIQEETVGVAEEAGAFMPLPEAPIETIPGEAERGTFKRFMGGVRNSGFGKAVKFIDTLGGIIPTLQPEEQQRIVIEAQKQELVDDIDLEIKNIDQDLDNQFKQMGIGPVGGALIGAAAVELGAPDVFFGSDEKVQNLKSTIETLNQMSTTISTAVNDGAISGRDALKAENNIRKILDLRRQQIKEIIIGSPVMRTNLAVIEIDTDLFEAQTENQLELNNVAIALLSGQAEPTEAELLITKQRLEKNKK